EGTGGWQTRRAPAGRGRYGLRRKASRRRRRCEHAQAPPVQKPPCAGSTCCKPGSPQAASPASTNRRAMPPPGSPVRSAPQLSKAMTCRTSLPQSEEHTSELQSRENLVCRLLLEKKKHK